MYVTVECRELSGLRLSAQDIRNAGTEIHKLVH
jgi:hypothetical protein